MSGVIPKRSTSGRKQWTIHDTSRSSLNRLRNQLANDGCPESQVVLAKQLLRDDQELSDQHANANLGVYWLIKASEQGNVEATELLKECLTTGKGISEQNFPDVQACIAMSQDEKVARKAAREMFASLSNGGEYITSVQLEKRMRQIDIASPSHARVASLPAHANGINRGEVANHIGVGSGDDASSSEGGCGDTEWSQRRPESSEKLTEEHVVEAAAQYARGALPPVSRALALTAPDLRALDHVAYAHRSIRHPRLALTIAYYKLIRFLGAAPLTAARLLRTDLQLIYVLVAYALLSTDNVLALLPVVIYALTIVVMIVTTFNMLQARREFSDFRLWSGLFLTYSGGSLDAAQAEYQYIKKNLRPYGQFFVALLANFLTYPLIAEVCLPQSELALLAFCMTFATLFGFMYTRRAKTVLDGYALLSFAVNVLARYPYDADTVVTQGWRYLDLNVPTLASHIVGAGVDICMKGRVALHACVPLALVLLASRERWRGVYKYAIPHCVTLGWFQLAVISSQGATTYGLIRGALALAGVALFVPLVGLTTLILPLIACARWLLAGDWTRATSACLCAILAMASATCGKLRGAANLIPLLLAALALYVALDSTTTTTPSSTVEPRAPIAFDVYERFCHAPAWQRSNVAATQLRCAHLEGARVAWEGYVHQVRVARTRNAYKSVIDKLPVAALRHHLYCHFGDERPPTATACDVDDGEECARFRELMAQDGDGRCHLDRHDVHTLEIVVGMRAGIWGKGADVQLTATVAADAPALHRFALRLRTDDRIWFRGALVAPGDRRIYVRVVDLGCTACQDGTLLVARTRPHDDDDDDHEITDWLATGLRSILNCVFYPILVFN